MAATLRAIHIWSFQHGYVGASVVVTIQKCIQCCQSLTTPPVDNAEAGCFSSVRARNHPRQYLEVLRLSKHVKLSKMASNHQLWLTTGQNIRLPIFRDHDFATSLAMPIDVNNSSLVGERMFQAESMGFRWSRLKRLVNDAFES